MKKPYILLSGLIFASVMLINQSCSNETAEVEESLKIIKPEGVITQARGEELYSTWKEKNTNLFSKAGVSKSLDNEASSFWWSLEDLRNYLDYAEQEAKAQGYNVTGMRVYLGAYPEKDSENTLFFAPTGYKTTSQASMFSSIFSSSTEEEDDDNIPLPPLNRGTGGQGEYP